MNGYYLKLKLTYTHFIKAIFVNVVQFFAKQIQFPPSALSAVFVSRTHAVCILFISFLKNAVYGYGVCIVETSNQ